MIQMLAVSSIFPYGLSNTNQKAASLKFRNGISMKPLNNFMPKKIIQISN